MNSCELAYSITAFACIIAQNKTSKELDILAAFFTQLGDTLATISTTHFE